MSTSAQRPAARPTDATLSRERSDAFPPGIPFIVGNEGAERFSFYGMRAILKVYLTALYLQFVAPEVAGEIATRAASSRATAVTHLFIAGVYAFPMLGALFADRLLGKYPVIFWLSLVYCAGHGVLAIAGNFAANESWQIAEYGFYVGLALIAIGSGGIKPCVSANVGDQFTSKNGHLVTKVFQIFYFIINFGSFFATIIIPILRKELGAEVAFGVPGIVMGIAAIVFWLGRDRFSRVPPNPGGKLGLLDAITSSLFFTPIIAVIAAVFVVSHGFEVPAKGTMGAAAFYWTYVTEYVTFLALHSWHFFAISLVLVIIGGVLFVVRQRKQQDTGFIAMTLYAIAHRRERKAGQAFFDTVRAKFGDDAAEGPPAVVRICLVFSMVSVFWALFDQHASTWITQAQAMNLSFQVPRASWQFGTWGTIALALFGGVWLFSWISNTPLSRKVTLMTLSAFLVVGVGCASFDFIWPVWEEQRMLPEQLSSLNPLMVMIIIPGLNILLYRPLEKWGITVRPLQKMTAGMFIAAVAFLTAALLQERVEAAGSGEIHALWQAVQYVVITTAEVLVSITGLEFAYTQAPRAMKSTIMGFWLLCVTGGNVLVAFLAPMETILPLSDFFWVFTALMAGAAIVFLVMALFYKGKTYLQAEAR